MSQCLGEIEYKTATTTTNIITMGSGVTLSSFYMERYKTGRVVFFYFKFGVSNSSNGSWKFKINKYSMAQTSGHVFNAFKGTGTYVPCYSDSDGYIVNQGGTGSYNLQISGFFITT